MGKGFLDNNVTFYAVFDKVSGMQVSDAVVVNGYQIGKVGQMKLVDNGKLKGKIVTELVVRNDINVPNGTLAILFSADLLGEMNVKFIYGDGPGYHVGGDTISTSIQGSMFEELSGELTPLTDKLGITVDNVNKLFDFDTASTNVQSLNYTIENLNKTMSTFQQSGEILNAQLATQLDAIDRILANLEKTTVMINSNEANISQSITNIKDLTSNLNELDLQATLTKVNTTVDELQITVAKVNDPTNSIGALLTEKELYDNLEQSTKNLELLLLDFRMNPKRYVHFSVFPGKKKNELEPVME